MKRIAILISLLTVACSFSYGQVSTDSISTKEVFGGYQFYQGDKSLNMKQLIRVMEPNEQAYKLINSAHSTSVFATIVGCVGGYMLGRQLGTAIIGGEPNWRVAGIGVGIIIVSIPINQIANYKAKQAVDIYNSGIKRSSFWDKNELKLSKTRNGFGLTLNF